MSRHVVGINKPLIKPDDLVRTPDGRTAVCVEVETAGLRLLRDVFSGALFRMHRDLLFIVRSAIPKPWPTHLP